MPLPESTEWLRANAYAGQVGVDREKNVLRGAVLAQEGDFKSAGRGSFDLKSLKQIVTLARKKPEGLKSRFGHPTLSDDGLGKYLGRIKDVRLDSVKVKRDGETILLHAVRGDLHFDKTALEEQPGGGKPLGIYVMDRAESDSDAISSSLVLQADTEERLDPKTKRPMLNEKGEPLPPLWRPTRLHASDVVDTGDAVDGLLSAGIDVDSLPDGVVRRASEMLGKAFGDAEANVVYARCLSWLGRYMELKYGPDWNKDGSLNGDIVKPVENSGIGKTVAIQLRRKLALLENS